MNRISKYSFAVVLSVISASLIPVNVYAIDGQDDSQTSSKISEIQDVQERKRAEASAKLTELCKRYSNSRINSDVGKKRNDISERLKERDGSLVNQRSEWDSKRTEARGVADLRRQEHYEKLLLAAISNEQKTAVDAFRKTVDGAVQTRRQSQDVARNTYRSGLDTLVNARKSEIEEVTKEFEQSVDAALAKAKTSCENGTPIETVKSALKLDLEKAKGTLKSSKESILSISESGAALLEQRKISLESAKETFESTLERARVDLKEAFAQDSTVLNP